MSAPRKTYALHSIKQVGWRWGVVRTYYDRASRKPVQTEVVSRHWSFFGAELGIEVAVADYYDALESHA